MGTVVKTFSNDFRLEFDTGRFDSWCVYFISDQEERNAPKDVNYFKYLKSFADTYGADKVYDDYVKIYDATFDTVDDAVFDQINTIAKNYDKDSSIVELIFSILYLTTISEIKKFNKPDGKRIKRLGVYKLLKENLDVSEAANFMCGMNWDQIDSLCKDRGF